MSKKSTKLFVLAYHKIEDLENFESQMTYLRKNYNILNDQGIKEYFQNKSTLSSKKNLIITFDDGDISNYSGAFPILKKLDIPAIFFIITDLVNSRKPFWWDEIEHILGKQAGYEKVWEVKKLPNQERLVFLDELRRNNRSSSFEYIQLTNLQLKEMKEAGMIIGNHSHTHPMFDHCTNEEIVDELKKSTSFLKEAGLHPDYFAYPNGNYSKKAEGHLKEYGVKYAFLFDHKINIGDVNPLRISRLIVNDTTPQWKFKLILSGWHSKILPLTKALGKIKK